jgi:formylglycine-generating enzyme required for sulfatase activity
MLPESSGTQLKGPASGSGCVGRGGSWFYSNRTIFRAANRFRNHPDYGVNYLGFRCAKAL